MGEKMLRFVGLAKWGQQPPLKKYEEGSDPCLPIANSVPPGWGVKLFFFGHNSGMSIRVVLSGLHK